MPALSAWGVLVGLLWSGSGSAVIVGVACAALLVAGLLLVARVRRAADSGGTGLAALSLAAIGLTTLCLVGHVGVRETGTVLELAAQQAMVSAQALVDGEPRALRLRPGHPTDERLVVVPVRLRAITGRGARSVVDTPVLVIGGPAWAQLRWRESISMTGRLAPAEPGQDVVALLRPTGDPVLLAEPPEWMAWADQVRSRFRSATAGLPADPAGLVPALVIGDTSATPAELTAAMTTAGLSHLSAVSGSNVAVVLAAALGLGRVAGVRRRWRPVLAAGALAGFVVLVRPEPSVLRAAVMGSVGLLGLSTGRRRLGLPALSGSVVGLLCWDPWLARSYGFALSVLATLGLLWLAGPWGRWVSARLPARLSGLGPALVLPVAAQVMCAPVVVLLAGNVSLVAVPANLLAAPLVAPATVAGVVVAIVAVVWVPAAAWLAWLAGLPAWGIALIGRGAAELPGGTLPWPDGPGGALLLTGLTVLALVTGPGAAAAAVRRPMLALAFLGLLAGALVPVRDVAWPLAAWRLVACDIGQGDALVVGRPGGPTVLVDVGPDPGLVDGCLDRLGVGALDAIVLTHFHADHVDGLPGVLRSRPVTQVFTSPVDTPPDRVDLVRTWAGAAGVPVSSLYAGDRLDWGDGAVQARVWWPERVIHAGSVANNGSVVLTVDVNGLHVALLGDIEAEAAGAIRLSMSRDPQLAGWPVDVLKVAHHGSANRDDRLLDLLSAPVALICVGVGNDYGHPAPSTLNALRDRGFRILRTDLDGDVAVGRDDSLGVVLVAARGP